MKVIAIKKWKEKARIGDKVEEHDVSICDIVNSIMNIAMSQENLKGFENVRKTNRIGNALDVSDKNGRLAFLDEDYDLVKGYVDKYCPANWGMNKDIMEALESFMNAKKEKE